MTILKKNIRQDILDRKCERCGEPLDEGIDFILTFYRGQFIVLHEECRMFLDTAEKGPRGKDD